MTGPYWLRSIRGFWNNRPGNADTVSRMTSSVAPVETSTERSREASRRQAEYYWRVLAEEREAVQQKLAKHELDLARLRSECQFAWDRSLRREIRRKQTELNLIDRLIHALEQRLLTALG
jgi:hypothetical protein